MTNTTTPKFFIQVEPVYYQRKVYNGERRYLNKGAIVIKTNDLDKLKSTGDEYCVTVDLFDVSKQDGSVTSATDFMEGDKKQFVNKINGEAHFRLSISRVNKNSFYNLCFYVWKQHQTLEFRHQMIVDTLVSIAFEVVSQHKPKQPPEGYFISENIMKCANMPPRLEITGPFKNIVFDMVEVLVCGLKYRIVRKEFDRVIAVKDDDKAPVNYNVFIVTRKDNLYIGQVGLQ